MYCHDERSDDEASVAEAVTSESFNWSYMENWMLAWRTRKRLGMVPRQNVAMPSSRRIKRIASAMDT